MVRDLDTIVAEAQALNTRVIEAGKAGERELASALEYQLEGLRREWVAAGGK